jgi:DNA-binding PadR family transcriptional regulator
MFDSAHHDSAARHHHRPPRQQQRTDPRHDLDNLPAPLRRLFGRGRPGHGTVRRGEIRPLILAVLTRRPMHGYEVIQELEEQSGGRWRPSAGSVYPTLQQLADEGLVTSQEIDGRRTYTLTTEGQAAAAAAPPRADWSVESGRGPDLRRPALELARAALQVAAVGTPRARREAERVLVDARREMYRLLADDEPADAGDGDDTAPA